MISHNYHIERIFMQMESGDFRVIHINAYAEYAYMVLCKVMQLKYVYSTIICTTFICTCKLTLAAVIIIIIKIESVKCRLAL